MTYKRNINMKHYIYYHFESQSKRLSSRTCLINYSYRLFK